jgi:N4-(beta-N-acetylglucosaminyl)-L-asparaginase
MKTTRRSFLMKTTLAFTGVGLSKFSFPLFLGTNSQFPVVISTWKHGMPANEAAWRILSAGGYALDAVEEGVHVAEADPLVTSVGYGGIPDARGKVTLDACIMDERGNAGSVAFLQHIRHPVSVARLVMEKTPHVMLSGKGALKFALENGFRKEKLLTRESRDHWRSWKSSGRGFHPEINVENEPAEDHDTISMLAIDQQGRLCGACTTSGLAYKMHGRVGDSPIIGAGLFVDGEVGAAAATGTGELVMKTLGSFLIVEFMRNGMNPADACLAAITRITEKIPEHRGHQVGFIALNISGIYGAASLQPGFDFALTKPGSSGMKEANSWYKKW